jgi:predicted nucleic acid-binding protein
VRVVIDASVALKWVLDEAESEAALALRGEDLIAPALWLVRRQTRFGADHASAKSQHMKQVRVSPNC